MSSVPWVALHDKCNNLFHRYRTQIGRAIVAFLRPKVKSSGLTTLARYFVNNSHKVHEAQEAGFPSDVSGFYSQARVLGRPFSSESFGYHPRPGQECSLKSGRGYRRRTLFRHVFSYNMKPHD